MSTEKAFTRPGHWYLLTGLLIGVGLGLFYSWVVAPVKYVDTAPDSLHFEFKNKYRALIASAYLTSGDLERARARLALLGDEDPIQVLTLQAQQALSEGDTNQFAYALALLADALKQPSASILTSPTPLIHTPGTMDGTAAPASPPTTRPATVTPRPIHSPTPRPTYTLTATIGAPFGLVSQESLCSILLPNGSLQIEIYDAAGIAVAGAEVIVTWLSGEEHIFTGFKPELGDGYADFLMTPGIDYSVQLAAGSEPVTGISAPACQSDGGASTWGAIRLVFQQP